MNLEESVRAAVHQLADDAPPAVDLATVARARGRRLRRRRRAGLGALVVALIAVTVTPYAVLRRDASPDPAPAQSATPAPVRSAAGDWWERPYPLPGGAIVTALSRRDVGLVDAPPAKTVRDGNVMLDRRTGTYVVLPASFYTVWGAPAGNRALASNGNGGTGIVEPPGGREIWKDFNIDPMWSSDGSQILFTTEQGFGIIETATGETRRQTTPMTLCPDQCGFTWLPGEREVAIARRDPGARQSEDRPDKVKDVAIYSVATGRLVRVVPVPGVPAGPNAWSRDGRLVLTRDQSFRGVPTHIVEVATGRTVGTVAGRNVHFLPDGRILSLTDKQADLHDATGRRLATQRLPADFQGRELSIGRP